MGLRLDVNNLKGAVIGIPKICFGMFRSVTIIVDHHFNWFQKKMISWCFGFTVEDYSEE